MDLERFCVKFFPRTESIKDETIFIPIFHDWIRLKALNGVLIDVADYRHVPDGPGVMLISHEINYSMDHIDGQFGLTAQRKLGLETHHKDRILGLVRAAAAFGSLLEKDSRVGGKITWEGGSFYYMTNDRLHAPNTDESFAAIKSDLEQAAAELYPDQSITVTRVDTDPRARLTAEVRVETSVDISMLAAAT